MVGKSIEDKVEWSFVDLRGYESETLLTIRYDNHGQAIDQHNPNKKRRKAGGGWTTWFVKIKKKKNQKFA